MGFTGLDYSILILYLIFTALLGAFAGRGQTSIGDYFLGGRNMNWLVISFSIVATETSTLTFIGAPAIAYSGNLTFIQVAFGYLAGKILVSLFLIPGYFKGEIQTAYQVLELRFGAASRTFAAALFQGTRLLADGVRLFATALVLSVVTHIGDGWTIFIIGAVTVLYTYYGGMRAVVWNDAIQLGVYLTGAALAVFMLLESVPGGWGEIVAFAGRDNKFQWIDFSLDGTLPYTLPAGLIGGAFLTFATHGTDQMMVQRYLACGSPRRSQAALIFSGVLVALQFLLFLVVGVMLAAHYHHFPPQQTVDQVDRIFPLFIVEEMPSGISGLVIAAIFAAAMSTLSSSLNSLSSSSLHDVYRKFFVREASEKHYLAVSRFLTLGWAALLMAVSFLARNWGEVLPVGLTITSMTMGSVLGIFLLGRFSPKVGQKAGLIGMCSGITVVVAVHALTSVAWTWFVLIGSLATVAAGLLAAARRSLPLPGAGPP